MKTRLRTFGRTLKSLFSDKGFSLYLIFNILPLAVFIVIFSILSNEKTDWIYNSLNTDISGIIMPIILAVVTLLITIELTLKQFAHNRFSKRLYLHTSRNILALVIFLTLSIFFAFSLSKKMLCCVFLFSISAIVVEAIFFSYDVFKLDSTKISLNFIKKIKKMISKKEYPKKEFSELSFLFRDAVINNDFNIVERILREIPSIVSVYLKNKHSIDLENNLEGFNNLWRDLDKATFFIIKENDDNLQGSRAKKISAISLSEIIHQAIEYSSEDVVEKSTDLVKHYFSDRDDTETEWRIFLLSLLDVGDNKRIQKYVDWMFDFYGELYFGKTTALYHIFTSLVYLIKSKRLVIDAHNLELIFKHVFQLNLKDESQQTVCALILFSLWDFSEDKNLNTFISNINFEENFFKYCDHSLEISYPVIMQVLEECKNNSRNKFKELRHVELINLKYYVYLTKKVDAFHYIKMSKDDFVNYPMECKSAISSLIINGESRDVRFYGEKIMNSVISQTTRSEEELLKLILETLGLVSEKIVYIDSEEKVRAIVNLYCFSIEIMDKYGLIDDNNYKLVVDNLFTIIARLYFSNSTYCEIFYEVINTLSADDCNYLFINNKSKKQKIEYVLDSVFYYAVTAIEDQKDNILKMSSSYIGYSLLFFLNDNNLFYRTIFEKYASKMFNLAVSLNYKESILFYLSTLFVVNLAYCLNKSLADSRHSYGLKF